MDLRFEVKSNRFPAMSPAMKRAIGAGFAQAKESLLADMQRRTPVLSGALRDSESADSDETSLTLSAGTDHGIYVHQGTRRMAARPFMRDAVEAGVPAIVDAITSAAGSALR
jgi:HK97 gp10 family phage protein